MFKRGSSRGDAWEGVVADKKRSSPDGQNMYHRVIVTLSDNTAKEIRVRRSLWNDLSIGDRESSNRSARGQPRRQFATCEEVIS